MKSLFAAAAIIVGAYMPAAQACNSWDDYCSPTQPDYTTPYDGHYGNGGGYYGGHYGGSYGGKQHKGRVCREGATTVSYVQMCDNEYCGPQPMAYICRGGRWVPRYY